LLIYAPPPTLILATVKALLREKTTPAARRKRLPTLERTGTR
jgi:hypothetical protein